jgi:cation transporter-like permease
MAVVLMAGLVAPVLFVLLAYYTTMDAYRYGLDPYTYGIPVVMAALDLGGACTLNLALGAGGVA